MRSLRPVLLVLSVLAVSGCDSSSLRASTMTAPDRSAIFAAEREEAFRIPPAERAAIPPMVDPAALERLLSWVRPEHRAEILGFYQQLGAEKVALGPAFGSTGRPEIDRIIEQLVVPRGKR